MNAKQLAADIAAELAACPIFLSCAAQLAGAHRLEALARTAADAARLAAVEKAARETAADPERNCFRIRKENDGYAVEQKQAMTNGTCQWSRVFWSRKREDAVKAAQRRLAGWAGARLLN